MTRGRPRRRIATRETSPEELERWADELIAARPLRAGRRQKHRARPNTGLILEDAHENKSPR